MTFCFKGCEFMASDMPVGAVVCIAGQDAGSRWRLPEGTEEARNKR